MNEDISMTKEGEKKKLVMEQIKSSKCLAL